MSFFSWGGGRAESEELNQPPTKSHNNVLEHHVNNGSDSNNPALPFNSSKSAPVAVPNERDQQDPNPDDHKESREIGNLLEGNESFRNKANRSSEEVVEGDIDEMVSAFGKRLKPVKKERGRDERRVPVREYLARLNDSKQLGQ